MAFWFMENHTDNVIMSIKVKEQIYSEVSDYQRIDIFESEEFGRVLALDGIINLTEKDEFIYHEMITHIPMAVHPHPERVLVVGAGDGGVLRELTKYDTVRHIDLVEIDAALVAACREHLPTTAVGYEDERVTVHNRDALRYLRRLEDTYDLIIIDSSDPTGPGEILFTKEFYGSCYKALKNDGIMVNQHESPFYSYESAAMMRSYRRIKGLFPVLRIYQAHIPSYPSGHWLFGFASKKYDPIVDFDEQRWLAQRIKARYYNPELHRGTFCLPTYVKEMLGE